MQLGLRLPICANRAALSRGEHACITLLSESLPCIEIICKHAFGESCLVNGPARIGVKDIPERGSEHRALEYAIGEWFLTGAATTDNNFSHAIGEPAFEELQQMRVQAESPQFVCESSARNAVERSTHVTSLQYRAVAYPFSIASNQLHTFMQSTSL